MTQKTLTKAGLRRFIGTEHLYRHWFMRNVLYTDGVDYVDEHASWLIDEIAFAQRNLKVAAEEFQIWKLRVNADRTATLTCTDRNSRVIHRKELMFIDFPLDEISFYFADNVILLPSEY